MKLTAEQIHQSRMSNVQELIDMGVTGIKLELEATFNRMGSSSHYCDDCDDMGDFECDDCYGNGERSCSTCDEAGEITVDGIDVQCGNCEGSGVVGCATCNDTGRVACSSCHGQQEMGTNHNFSDEGDCLTFMLEHIGLSRDQINSLNRETPGANAGHSLEGEGIHNPTDWLRYISFYNDHSVDSECTFTIRLRQPEDVNNLVKVTEAFLALGEAIGNGMRVDGAGMHMGLIFDRDCTYPSNTSLSQSETLRFRDSMKTLMPALFFLGASNGTTRSMSYRQPNVSCGERDSSGFGSNEKYSAIHMTGGCIEFRVFDTCYDKLEQIIDNVVVMKNCLALAKSRNVIPTVVRSIREYRFGHDNGRELRRLYATADIVELLNAGLRRIKPGYYTIRELKKQREFSVSLSKLRKEHMELELEADRLYREYDDRFEVSMKFLNIEMRNRYIRDLVSESSGETLRLIENEDPAILEGVERRVREYINSRRREKANRGSFISQHIDSAVSRMSGRTRIRVLA